MRTVLAIITIGCLSMIIGMGQAYAQTTLHGAVIDAETGKPLPDVHVYLSGTKIGTATDTKGNYQLQDIPAGGYRLIVSRIGYATAIEDIIIGPDEVHDKIFELKPVIYKMSEIYVGEYDDDWKKNLERFTNLFIGESPWADSVKILNPRVLRFEKKWWGKFTARALAPLQIQNRALGYYLTYHLEEFEHTGSRTRWDGEPLFRDMTPADSAEAAQWESNREKAFYGSLRHFLLALLDDRLGDEGFVLYNLRQNTHGYSNRRRWRSDGQRYIDEKDESYLYDFNFFGRLEIIYTREPEVPEYTEWLRNPRRAPKSTQTSYLELNERPITVDSDGEIIQPYGATQYGYFSFSRLALATPRQYRPDDYPSVSGE